MATLLDLYRVRELYLNEKPVMELRMGSAVLWRSELSGDIVLRVFTSIVEDNKESVRCILVHSSDVVFDANTDLNTILSQNGENYSALVPIDETGMDAGEDLDDIMTQIPEGLACLLFHIPVVHAGNDDIDWEVESYGRLLRVNEVILQTTMSPSCHRISSGRILCLHGVEKALPTMKPADERASSGTHVAVQSASVKDPAAVAMQLGIRAQLELASGSYFVYPDMTSHLLHFSTGRMVLVEGVRTDGDAPLATGMVSSGTFVVYNAAYIEDYTAPVMTVAKSGNLIVNAANDLADVSADSIMNAEIDMRESLLPFDAQALRGNVDVGEDSSPLLQCIVSDDQDASTEVALVEDTSSRTLLVGGNTMPAELAVELAVREVVEPELYCRWIYPEKIGDALRIVQVYTAEVGDDGSLSLT